MLRGVFIIAYIWLGILAPRLVLGEVLPTSFSGINLSTGQKEEVQFASHPTRDSLESKGLVITFLSSKCPCSHAHLPALRTLPKKYPEFIFLGIHSNADETELEAKEYFSKLDLPFPVLTDSGAKIADQFGAYKTPHVYVVSPKGASLYEGGISNSRDLSQAEQFYLDEALSKIRRGEEADPKRTKALGCVIARP